MPPHLHWKYFQQLKLKTLKTWNQHFQFYVNSQNIFNENVSYNVQSNIFLSLFFIFTENENENENGQTKRLVF